MDTLTPFMLEAKREYLSRLTDDVAPFIVKDMKAMYEEAKKQHSNKALLTFQCTLKQIQKWNAAVLREKTDAVERKCPWLSSLIAAVFVSYIKVMSSVRVSQNDRPNIRLKLPANDTFIHQVYVETARALYENPSVIRSSDAAAKTAIVQAAIETTIRDQLPLQDILQAYLGKSIDEEGTMAPVLSPVHSDDDEPSERADDSAFARAAEPKESFTDSESSEEEEEEEEQQKYIPVPEATRPPPMPRQTFGPPPTLAPPTLAPAHSQGQTHFSQPLSHFHSPAAAPQATAVRPPAPPQPGSAYIPEAPKALFEDAEDGHF